MPRFAAQQAPAAEPDAGLCSASAGEQQSLRRQSVLLVRNSRRLDCRSPGFCSPPVAATSVVPSRRPVLVQRGSQIVSAETPRRATFNSPEDTVRVGIATSALASWHLAASGPNLKATVRGDSTAHRPGTCLRVETCAGDSRAEIASRARTPFPLSQKARVRTCPTLTRSSLALPPISRRALTRRRASAFLGPPSQSSRCLWRHLDAATSGRAGGEARDSNRRARSAARSLRPSGRPLTARLVRHVSDRAVRSRRPIAFESGGIGTRAVASATRRSRATAPGGSPVESILHRFGSASDRRRQAAPRAHPRYASRLDAPPVSALLDSDARPR